MKRRLPRSGLVLLLLLALGASTSRLNGQEGTLHKFSDAELIRLLGSDSFAMREAASLELMRRGPDTALAVAPAVWSDDAEVRGRAEYVLGAARGHHIHPSDKTVRAGFTVEASNPRFWAGQNSLLGKEDRSLDCDLKISSPHTVLTIQSPVYVRIGRGDDGSEVSEQVWAKNVNSVCHESFTAAAYHNVPGPEAKTVKVSAILLVTVAPLEILTAENLEPEAGKCVLHEDSTWIESLKSVSKAGGSSTLTFRLYDLAGRIGEGMSMTALDAKGDECESTSSVVGRSRYSADFVLRTKSVKPAKLTLRLPATHVRELDVPVEYNVQVPEVKK